MTKADPYCVVCRGRLPAGRLKLCSDACARKRHAAFNKDTPSWKAKPKAVWVGCAREGCRGGKFLRSLKPPRAYCSAACREAAAAPRSPAAVPSPECGRVTVARVNRYKTRCCSPECKLENKRRRARESARRVYARNKERRDA